MNKNKYEELINTSLHFDRKGNYDISERRGIEAESFVMSYLEQINYPQYHNYTFEYNNKIYKIDHLLISPNGLFIIETKRWRGVIKQSSKVGFVEVKTKRYGTNIYKDPTVELDKIKNGLMSQINIMKRQFKIVIIFVDSDSVELENKSVKFFFNIKDMMLYLKRRNKKLDKKAINNLIIELNNLYRPISRTEYYSLNHD
jgi:hypothetical protein